MSLDQWRERSPSIPICIPGRGQEVVIGTFYNDYTIRIKSISDAIVRGNVLNTPPKNKHFKKGDDVIFHMDQILRYTLPSEPICFFKPPPVVLSQKRSPGV